GALALGTVGVGALLRPWSGGGHASEAGSAPHPSTGAPTTGGPAPGDGEPAPTGSPTTGGAPTGGAVPARYLGTWEGKAAGLGGTLPMGTFRVTVHQARVGESLGQLRQTDQIGAVCTDLLTLKKVTGTRLLATSVGAKDNHPGCDPAPHQIELTPVGDHLKYTSESESEGHPVAELTKTG
ncbi:serine/threonine protein kinase, partial [Streptomyces sp. SID6137]|nr:serine/threonine protein kinase [Streptomyces sp. SID6137]